MNSIIKLVIKEDDIEGTRRMVAVNAARCKLCNDVIISTRTDELVTCSCHNLTIGGGQIFRLRVLQDSFASYSEESYAAQEGMVIEILDDGGRRTFANIYEDGMLKTYMQVSC